MKLANLFAYIEDNVPYILWCIRYPALRMNRFRIGYSSRLDIGPHARLRFGRDINFRHHFIGDFYGKVTLGNNVGFQHNCHVSAHEELIIGDNCMFGEWVSIHDENHVVTGGSDPIGDRGYVTKPIIIGKNVWVGAKATILPGVHIGDNAVIGANAVVTHDVLPYTIVGGIPARALREIQPHVHP
jgi:maltose O-acetyltransferase